MIPESNDLILAAGMPRSASTWLFNAARILLSDAIGEEFSCGWIGDLNRIPQKNCMLIKLHEYDHLLVQQSRYIMYSFRDIRDAIASNYRKFGEIPCMEEADYLIYQYEKWASVADFIMRYESMITDKISIIKKLGEDLEIYQFSPEEIIQRIKELSYENEGEKNIKYHRVNLYHPGHITDGRYGSWNGFIDPELIKKIEIKYKHWFVKCGYPLNYCSV